MLIGCQGTAAAVGSVCMKQHTYLALPVCCYKLCYEDTNEFIITMIILK